MLRPATPLAILFFIAFVLLLLSSISVPIVKAIPLCSYAGVTFGVFGLCYPGGVNCTAPTVGYNYNDVETEAGGFSLPSGTRSALSSILIVHPIAAFMTLVCAVLAAASHFHTPGHSSRYLLFLLILSFPTLLVSLLAFLVDILLFVPHLQWGGWIVLVATLLITLCSVLTCAMRRTLVSRKARKKRIAENTTDVNGAAAAPSAYYPSRPVVNQFDRAESPPPLDAKSSLIAGQDKLPQFAAFTKERPSSEDRVPLTSQTEPSINTTNASRTPFSQQSTTAVHPDLRSRPLPAPSATGASDSYDSGHRSPVSPMEQMEYGEPAQNGRGPPYDRRRDYNGPPAGAFLGPGGRGRGMPPQRARGGYPPRGMPYGRGGPGGVRGPPPPGWRGRGGYPPRGMPPRGGPAFMRGGPGMRPPPPGWQGDQRYMGSGVPSGPAMPPTYASGYGEQSAYNDDLAYDVGHNPYTDEAAVAAPLIPSSQDSSRPVALDSRHAGSTEPHATAMVTDPYSGARSDQNEDIGDTRKRRSTAQRDPASFGFSGRHVSPARSLGRRTESPPPPLPTDPGLIGQAMEMDAMPAHAIGSAMSGPVELASSPPAARYGQLDGPKEVPAELAAHRSASQHSASTRAARKSEDYYEDVDPRFARDEPHTVVGEQTTAPPPLPLPSVLVPGNAQTRDQAFAAPRHNIAIREPSGSSFYGENAHAAEQIDRTRSPAHSDTSNFTSVSQRGINPNWRPSLDQSGLGPAPTAASQFGRGAAPRVAPPSERILEHNPDFSLGLAPGHRRNQSSGQMNGAYPASGALH